MHLQQGYHRFWQNKLTATYGINGNYLGPVIEVYKGDNVILNVNNHLKEPSTLHWHGVHLPAKMDGGPHQVVYPSKTWVAQFTIKQNAATLWYHSHMHQKTAKQVYLGLAGLLIIKDSTSDALTIPKNYAVDDIPVIIQDRSFHNNGNFKYGIGPRTKMMGMKGNTILVNGTVAATFKVTQQLTRLRLLNASNARIYTLAFSDKRPFKQIATDGGLLAKPVILNSITLAPAERAEIIVELADYESVYLMHQPKAINPVKQPNMVSMMAIMSGNAQAFPVLRLYSKKIQASPPLALQLANVKNWQATQATKVRLFTLKMDMFNGRLTINDKTMDMNKIDEVIHLNAIEIWVIQNRSAMAHPFHIHDIQFRILSRNGHPPLENEQGLKDTVLVNPNEQVRIITQFEHYADARVPYMYHCHILEHEDAGMMGQFIVSNN